jgi:hypothetical protein
VHPACVDDECQGTPSQPPTELRPGSSTFGSAPAKQSGHRRKHHANPKRKCGRDSKRKKSRRCHGTRQAHHDHGGAK